MLWLSATLPAEAQQLPPPVSGFADPAPLTQVQVTGEGDSLQRDRAIQENLGRTARQQIRLDPPGPERLFRLESEHDLEERLYQEALDATRPGETPQFSPFPEPPELTDQEYQGRSFPRNGILIEPHFVNHGRLYFQDISHERYGWDLGFITPVVSATRFFKDVVFLPHNFGARPHCRWESSAGYCFPGDPVPYMMYPPEIDKWGLGVQAGTVLGLAGIFP